MIVLVPSTIALLPSYAGLTDPVAELRASCLAALSDLVADGPPSVSVACSPVRPEDRARGVTEPAGMRIARHLLGEVGWTGPVAQGEGLPLVVVANGSACRSGKAPGHLDERAAGFDSSLERALRLGDAAALASVDESLASALWCHDAPAFHALARALSPGTRGEVLYGDDPYGVQYWVVVWR